MVWILWSLLAMACRRQILKLPHHDQSELCSTRPSYRQGRQLTAVKVYTVNDESQHLLISGVPALGLQDDLRRLCSRFGDVLSLVYVPNYTEEKFVETYHVQYVRIQSARFAKRHLDGRAFFGGSLHVCYAPEMETVTETKNKLSQRRREVAKRCCSDTAGEFSEQPVSNSSESRDNQRPPFKSDNLSCIWNGVTSINDPRILPAEGLEMASRTTYGQPPSTTDWSDVGLRDTKLIPHSYTKRKGGYCTEGKLQVKKPNPIALALPLSVKHTGSGVASFTSSTCNAQSKVPPILKLIPSQVKGATKKIVFHQKDKNSKSEAPATGDASLDATILSVRERIRSAGIPNIQILLEKKHRIPEL